MFNRPTKNSIGRLVTLHSSSFFFNEWACVAINYTTGMHLLCIFTWANAKYFKRVPRYLSP